MHTADHPEQFYRSQELSQNDTVEQAKRLLMERLGLSEPEAHHYLQRSAMDRRIPKIAAARDVLHLFGKL